ncbi:MAG: gliding motility-associated C-terminal domain-containing protein [Bacteroidetes bacterium]|nr:gliding motility-associated C-terminal domain-containing protein [Bacteroidota bacterium]
MKKRLLANFVVALSICFSLANAQSAYNPTVNSEKLSLSLQAIPIPQCALQATLSPVKPVVTGGSGNYKYKWSNGETTLKLYNYEFDRTYLLAVTDDKGNTVSQSVYLPPTSYPTVTLTATNVSDCLGACDGTATALVSGGAPPYTYSWSNGVTAVTASTVHAISGLCPGTYTVTVIDTYTCYGQATAGGVVSTPTVGISFTKTNETCTSANGSITANPTGGTSYTYLWSNAKTTQTITGASAGVYTVTVTANNGCTASASTSITNTPAGTAAITQTNVLCYGNSTGSAKVTMTGGTSPFSYTWSTGFGNQTQTGLAAGNYTVTVKDDNDCIVTATVTITQPAAPLSGTVTTTNVACFGGSTGSALITPSGGTGAYTYSWSNGRVVASNTSLSAGSYTIRLTDANGCSVTYTATINQPTSALSATVTSDSTSCNGIADGGAIVTAGGGTPNYTYLWSNGATTSINTNLLAGTYTVTVTDDNGCTVVRTTTVLQPAALSVTVTSISPKCGFANGSVSASASGGSPTYSYSWNTTTNLTNLPAGVYTLTVSDINGCKSVSTTTLTDIAGGTVTIASQTNVLCFGGATGVLTATNNGGTAPFSYSWSNGFGLQTITTLTVGVYSVTMTDANSCTSVVSATVTQPATAVSGTIATTPSGCTTSIGSATITSSGGTGGHTYFWSNGGNTNVINNLSSGVYTCTVTDANGCKGIVSTTLTNLSGGTASVTTNSNVSCNGGSNASATANMTGGQAPFTYIWSNGSTAQVVNGLSAATYTVVITDFNGCSSFATVSITQPTLALGGVISNSVSACSGNTNGVATANPTGGTGAYTYFWNTTQTTQSINGLGLGAYSVLVTDANGCTTTLSTTVTSSGGPVVSVSGQTNVSCNAGNNGSATATVTNGTPAITYLWSNAATGAVANNLAQGTYTVTVLDANNCSSQATVTITEPTFSLTAGAAVTTTLACANVNNAVLTVTATGGTSGYSYILQPGNTTNTTGVFSGLGSGTFTVTVSDANGCTALANGTNSIVITQPTPITVTVTSSTNATCNGASSAQLTAVAIGGGGSYTYSLSPGAVSNTSGLFTALAAGTYTVVVSDTLGCVSPVGAVHTITQPAAISISTNAGLVNESCPGDADGSATVTATGGNGGFSYLLQPSSATNTTGVFAGLTAGSYTVQVTDNLGCFNDFTFSISNSSNGIVIALNDNDSTEYNTTKSFDVYQNDTAVSSANISVLIAPVNGTVVSISNGLIEYKPNQDFTGNDSLVYEICDQFCALKCDTAKLYIRVLQEVLLNVPNGFSPDGDNINDKWVVRNLDRFGNGNNKVEIYNRWGDKVYEANPYKNDWDGVPNKGVVNIGDGKVVAGTYYYVLTIEGLDTYKGYLEIRR